MKKIYFLHKHPTKLGNVIEYRGFRATVTEELIGLNPELFTVEDTMQELLDKAKRDYPVGTMFNSKHGVQKVLGGEPFIGIAIPGTIQINTDQFTGGATIYTPEDGWCEILPIKFITEDGVSIYGDMRTYLVGPHDRSSDICSYHHSWNGDSNSHPNKYFYHKKNALAYIEKHKEKTLEDYEQMLFNKGDSMTFSPKSAYFSIYAWIRDNEPKLYYTKILQLIADDLNDGWEPDFTNYDEKWYITKKTIDYFYGTIVQGIVYFKLSYLAEKARDILGDKLEYLFN